MLQARSQLAAFERYSIESAQSVLAGAIENVSRAASEIADTDVAVESAGLVRSLILADTAASTVRLAGTSHRLAARLLDDVFGAVD